MKTKLFASLSLLLFLNQPVWSADTPVAGAQPTDEQLKKGDMMQAGRKYKEAVDYFRDMARKFPDSAKVHARLGASLATLHDSSPGPSDDLIETAILEEKQAMKLDPTYGMPHVILGQIYGNQHKDELAIEEFRKALAIKPKMYQGHLDLGMTLWRVGKIDEAITHLKTARDAHPEELLPHLNLGIALSRKGDLKGAIAEEEEALRINKNAYDAYINLGNFYLDAGDLDNAKEKFERGLALAPGHPNGLSGLGWAMGQKGFKKDAIKYQRQALKSYPGFVVAHTRLGMLLTDSDKPAAEAEFKKALELSPNDLGAMFEYAKFLQTNGQKDAAKEQYKKVLKIKPDFSDAQKALAALESAK